MNAEDFLLEIDMWKKWFFYTIQGAFLFYILGNPFIFDTESPVSATQFPDTESRRRNIIPV